MSLKEIKEQTQQVIEEVLELSKLQKGQIFVLGLSSSEVIGGHIGKNSSMEVGKVVVETILEILEPKGIYLAVQGCEHLNRALVVERELAIQKDLEIVNVLPTLHAGGSGQLAAFKYMKDPVEVEFITAQAGVDIGDTAIGMHIKHVQVPVRPSLREIGQAHVTALASRPKLIGGVRAAYQEDKIRKGS
ncbi:TIGR01440 family protein [Streptococcus suis]